ncbi:tRNA (guanine(37)-N1)-methyltransferase, partial [Cladochytrium tenue]
LDALPEQVREFAVSVNAELVKYPLKLDYDYWSTDQILRSILPDDVEVPSSFDLYTAHLNLRNEYQPYKHIVGQVILDKNKYVKTVVNKLDTIDTTFRFFKMEVLAGEEKFETELKENNCRFQFDFSTVYWNSRLQKEHDRIIQQLKASDRVCDVFAGVGPFAVPAAKNKRCCVYANDLNPASFKYLEINSAKNKVENLVKPFNMDGREFIKKSLDVLNSTSPDASTTSPGNLAPFQWFSHYIMNLPATAVTFLDAFRGLFNGREQHFKTAELPTIHCYCFSKADDCEADALRQVQESIGCQIPPGDVRVHRVRDVAPKKEMLCVSFKLPREAAFHGPPKSEKRELEEAGPGASGFDDAGKRVRVDGGDGDLHALKQTETQ